MISSQKRNPFKKLSTGPSKPVVNPLIHLTNKVMGYSESQDMNLDPTPIDGEVTTTPNESNGDFNNDNTENININEVIVIKFKFPVNDAKTLQKL